MHLITAAVVSALLGRKRGVDHNRLPSFAGVMETTHVLPGRIRLRAPILIGNAGRPTNFRRVLPAWTAFALWKSMLYPEAS